MEKEKTFRNVAAYCRVSTGKDEQINSLENQKMYFESYIQAHENWRLTGVYCDEGKSGTTTEKRSGFNQMIFACQCGLIDTIITKEVSRFARNTVDTLEYTRMLGKLGINVIFINDGIDTSDGDGELRLSIMSSIAQEESRRTSERVKWGQRRQMEKGVVFGRNLLGYDVRNGKLYINEAGAEVVRFIFSKYADEGKGVNAIAKELNEAGIKPMKAEEWSGGVILKILHNEKYVGDICQGKTYTSDSLDHEKKYQSDKSKLIYISNHHEPIVSDELWQAAQERLKFRSHADRRGGCRYWCSGKIICGICGRHYVRRTKKLKSQEIYCAWRCSASNSHGRQKNIAGTETGCNNQSANEAVLLESVCSALKFTDFADCLAAEDIKKEILSVTDCGNEKAAEIQRRIKAAENCRLVLGRKLAEGVVSDSDYLTYLKSYDDEISCLNARFKYENTFVNLHDCEKYVKKLLLFSEPNVHICEEITEHIIVFPDHVIEVKLEYIPFSVRMKYESEGRGKNFRLKFVPLNL